MKRIIAVLSLIPVIALADVNHSSHNMPMDENPTNNYSKEYDAINIKMHKDMSIRYTDNPDVDFVKGMIAHHQGAVDMAKVQLKYGKSEEMKKLAESIIEDQNKEINQMEKWLSNNK